MTKTDELLYALAGARDDETVRLCGELADREWPDALHRLRAHGLAPMLSHVLREAGADGGVPQESLWQLRSVEEGARLWRAIQVKELALVLNALKDAGIPHLLMKGLALSQTVYPAAHLRVMADSDVLIPVKDREKAIEVVMALGYDILEPWHAYHHIPELYKPNRHPLELHLNCLYIPAPSPLYRPLDIPFERFVEAGRETTLGGAATHLPSPTDMFLQLACNFVSDFEIPIGRPMRWIRDFAQLIRKSDPPIDWAGLKGYCDDLDPDLAEYMALVLALVEPFLTHLYSDELRSFRATLPPRYSEFVKTVTPEVLTKGWGRDPLRVFHLLSKLMGPRNAAVWAWRKVFVPTEHIVRQTQRSPKSLTMRLYPLAFFTHLKHHLVDGGGTPPRLPPPVT